LVDKKALNEMNNRKMPRVLSFIDSFVLYKDKDKDIYEWIKLYRCNVTPMLHRLILFYSIHIF